MKKTHFFSGAFLAFLVATNAQAETYDGVLQSSGIRSREDVAAEAVSAAGRADPFRESGSSGVIAPLALTRSRDAVNAEAIKEAHSANQNLTGKAYYRDVIPSQYVIQPQLVNAAK